MNMKTKGRGRGMNWVEKLDELHEAVNVADIEYSKADSLDQVAVEARKVLILKNMLGAHLDSKLKEIKNLIEKAQAVVDEEEAHNSYPCAQQSWDYVLRTRCEEQPEPLYVKCHPCRLKHGLKPFIEEPVE